ncbi:MAG: HEAT repeat domain-containing protein, partial [Xenococcus sp. (in: cyanobacteria)]
MEDNSVYKKVVDSLCKGLREEPLPEIRIYIVKMLREIGNEDAILSLAIAIQDQNYHVRQAALEALRNSEIVKIGFLSYFKNFFNSQEISQEIIEEEAMLKHIGKTIFTFKKGDITMEKNPKVQQNLHGNIGNVVGNVEGNFEVKGNVNFNSGSSLEQISQELEQILDKIINKNLLAAQKQA